jgi:hypothetical protein
VVSDPAPILADPVPVLADPVPVLADPVPVVTDPAPVLTDPVPVLADPVPVVSDLAPVLADLAPVLTDPVPVLTDPIPVLTDPFPVLADPAPILADSVLTDPVFAPLGIEPLPPPQSTDQLLGQLAQLPAYISDPLPAVAPVAAALQAMVTELVRLIDALMGGAPGEDQDLLGQLGGLADVLARFVDGLLGTLFGESGQTPNPADTPPSPVAVLEGLASTLARYADALYDAFDAFPWQLAAGPGGQVDPLQVHQFLVDLGARAPADPSSTQGAPTMPAQAPTVPSTPPSGGPSSSTGFATGASGAFASANGAGSGVWLLLGGAASLAIVLRGGRSPWASHLLLKPTSALRLAIERPG